MPVRSGSFSGLGGIGGLDLDPFGGGRGGLGRYVQGDPIDTIEAAERYAIAIGWQNGTVTDAEYLASLARAITLEPEGTRGRIAAQNTYDDAVYTIGRNKIVRKINGAATDQGRIDAYQELIGYDKRKLQGMVGDNEQTRELRDRIQGAEGDIRNTRWSQLVRQYNENKKSNQSMLDFARIAAKDAQGAPDQQTWTDRVFEFSERIKDEHLEKLKQDYDFDRVSGQTVLAFVTQRLGEMAPGSPRYADLSRWREDFAKSFHADEAAQEYAAKYSAYQEGRLGDDEWLRFLHTRVQDAGRGTEERRAAEHDLIMETFRVGENKLIYEINVNGKPVTGLIRFYQTALRSMDHNSARALDLQTKIHDLKLNGIGSINLGGESADPDYTGPGHTTGGYNNNTPGGRGNGSAGAEAMIAAARSYLGTDYRVGGESRQAIDCSGLIYRAFTDAGLGGLIGGARRKAAGYQTQAANNGEFFNNRGELSRGDLVMYNNGKHIGIYLGNGKVLSALTTGVAVHSINGIGERVTGFIRPSYAGAQPTPRTPTGNQGNQSPGHTTGNRPGGNGTNPNPRPTHETDRGGMAASLRSTRPPPENDEAPQKAKNPAEVTTGRRARQAAGAAPLTTGGGLVIPSSAGTAGAGATVAPTPHANTGTQQGPPTAGAPLPGAMSQMAKELLRQMGVGNPSDPQIRAIGAWLVAENGNTVTNNNPFHLITQGGSDLPGQIGRDGSGFAQFGTWEAGIAAAANEIKAYYPTIASSIRQGDPEGMLSTIERSDWRSGGYGNQLIPVYNESGPGAVVIGGTRIFSTPQSLTALAHQAPQVADLFEVDWNDASNKEWFMRNFDQLEAAFENFDPTGRRDAGNWQFITENGTSVSLPFAPEMYYSALEAKGTYEGNNGDRASTDTLEKLRSVRAVTTLEQYDYETDQISLEVSRLFAEGRISEAVAKQSQAIAAGYDLLDLDPQSGVDLDTAFYTGSLFEQPDLERIQKTLDHFNPRTDTNPGGDPLLGLLNPDVVTPDGTPPFTIDHTTHVVSVNPNFVYFSQADDGKFKLVTWQTDGAQFDQIPQLNPLTGETHNVPRYMSNTRAIAVGTEVVPRFTARPSILIASVLDGGGYKTPVDYSTIGGDAFAGTTGGGDQSARDRQDLINRRANNFAGGPYVAGGQPTTQPPPVLAPQDYVARPAGNIPIDLYSYYDVQSKGRYQAYSLDGGKTFLVASTDVASHPPTPVLDPNAVSSGRIRFGAHGLEVPNPNPNAAEKWLAYDPATHGPLAQFFHWYGTDPRDNASPTEIGAKGSRYIIRHAGSDGGFNGSLSRDDTFTFTDDRAWEHAATKFGTKEGRTALSTNAKTAWVAKTLRDEQRAEQGLYGSTGPKPAGGLFGPATTMALTARTMAGDDPNAILDELRLQAGVRISGSTTASNTRAVAASARLTTGGGLVLTSTTPTAPPAIAPAAVAPPIAADRPKTPQIQAPAAPAPITPRTTPPVVTPPRPSPVVTPRPVNPRPGTIPNAPGPKPTLPGVSQQPRGTHEYD